MTKFATSGHTAFKVSLVCAMTHNSEVDESEILKLYRDISFPGSFRGIKTLRSVLKTDKGIDISQQKLYQILQKEPNYLIHQLKPFKTKTRTAITHNYGELVQADIAYMFENDPQKEKYFLLLIDVYSNKIFVEILLNRDGPTVAKALENIFKRFGSPIYEIQTDKGTEFVNRYCKALFKKLKIVFRTKRGIKKSSFAESAIFRVKRKLYIYLRTYLTKKWTEHIEQIVQSLNNIPLKRLGYLTPNSISDVTSSVLVDNNLKAHNLVLPKDVTFDKQIENQKKYEDEAKTNEHLLQKGNYVYLKVKEDAFGKSFDIQVSFELACW